MQKIVILIFSLFSLAQTGLAQKNLPVLKTKSNAMSIKEGDFLYQDAWTANAEIKIDTFITQPFTGSLTIKFMSDMDTLSFKVKPNKKYNFIIETADGRKAYTQINTSSKLKPSLSPKLFYTYKNKKIESHTADTIPFTFGKDGCSIYIKGIVNNSTPLDFFFDTGAGSSVIKTSSITNKKVSIHLDGQQINQGSDGIDTVQSSSKNTFEIDNLVWKNVDLLSIDYGAKFNFDIVLGINMFEDKIIQIDYDKKQLIISKKLPEISQGYSKLDMKLMNGIPYIKCKLIIDNKEYEEWFDLDTGSNKYLFTSQKFAADNSIIGKLKYVKVSTVMGSTGVVIKQNNYILPKLQLGAYAVENVPIGINEIDPTGVEHIENIGSQIIKHFNLIIDLQNNALYIKPNSLFNTKFE